jgi:predicted amidohydrolase YtcJ
MHRSHRVNGFLAVAALFVLAGCAGIGEQRGPADVVLLNGKVVTVDQRFSIADGLAVKGDRIIAVGSNSDIRQLVGPGTRVVELGGRTVIPGLIDNHTHAIRAAERWTQEARIDGITSRKQALDIIAAKARAARPGEWVLVLGGWTEDQFVDGKGGFTREELDAAAPDNPVLAQVLFARGYANTLALKAAGLDREDPARLRVLPPPAISRVRKAIPPVPGDEWRAGLRALMRDFNRVGLTSVIDVGGNGFTLRHYEPIAEFDRTGELTLRFYYMRYMSAERTEDVEGVISQIGKLTPRAGSDYFRLLGIGENVFGPTTDNTYRPFEPSDAAFDQWERLAAAAATRGLQVHQHMTHDTTIRAFLDRIERVNASTPILPLRWTLAHLDGISKSTLERVRRLGVGVAVHSRPSIQGQMVIKRWGNVGLDMPPLRMIRDSGVVMGLGSDTTIVAPYNPFVSLWWAVTGKMLDGTRVNSQTLTRAEALAAHTRANAWLMFEEKQLGTLEPGKLADLVVLDRDYLTVPEDAIKDLKPVLTMVGGKVVYEAAQ